MIAISRRLVLTAVVVSGVVGLFEGEARSQSDPVLTVQGTSEVQVPADMATVRLGVIGQAPTAEAAQMAVNAAAGAVLAAVRQVGIDERHIQTSRLVLSPVYSRPGGGDENVPRIEAYRATNSVSVRVEDLTLLGNVLDSGLGAGANQLEGVFFAVLDDRSARETALRQAIGEARAKAEAMASALGVRIDGVLSVDEGGVFVQQPQLELARGVALQAAVPTPVSAGEITVSASVTVRYRIDD
jgi:uncharacterized protein